jgi:hypothetical protein
MLPDGAEIIDRHEIIARRGVASDRVVDTQVPQSSIYTYTAEKETRFTDTDAEIFGLSQDDVNIVRAAFKVLETPELAEKWLLQKLQSGFRLAWFLALLYTDRQLFRRLDR